MGNVFLNRFILNVVIGRGRDKDKKRDIRERDNKAEENKSIEAVISKTGTVTSETRTVTEMKVERPWTKIVTSTTKAMTSRTQAVFVRDSCIRMAEAVMLIRERDIMEGDEDHSRDSRDGNQIRQPFINTIVVFSTRYESECLHDEVNAGD
jgi:hypothetical protein